MQRVRADDAPEDQKPLSVDPELALSAADVPGFGAQEEVEAELPPALRTGCRKAQVERVGRSDRQRRIAEPAPLGRAVVEVPRLVEALGEPERDDRRLGTVKDVGTSLPERGAVGEAADDAVEEGTVLDHDRH